MMVELITHHIYTMEIRVNVKVIKRLLSYYNRPTRGT
jgi:hypothetical protein